MNATQILMLAAGLTVAAGAWAGSPAAGEKLVTEKNCAACHQRLIGGDGSKLYLRSDRKVKSLSQLHAQVSFCSSQLKTGWFPEDEGSVAAWLNQLYYRFEN